MPDVHVHKRDTQAPPLDTRDTHTSSNCGVSIICSNCGESGHVYRSCPHPVTSYGIMCFRLTQDAGSNSVHPEFLMVQRKDSLGFVEFVRGKYHTDDTGYIGALLSNMTVQERVMLSGACQSPSGMEQLWRYLWRDLSATSVPDKQHQSQQHRGRGGFVRDFEDARQKFERIRLSLPDILQRCPSEVIETEWGFPKGRRNMNESDLACAKREFQEETGMDPGSLQLNSSNMTVEEMFLGSNGVWYRHVYFLACVPPKPHQTADDCNYCSGEIRSVSWFSYGECMSKIRPAYQQRRSVLERVNSAILDSLLATGVVCTLSHSSTHQNIHTRSKTVATRCLPQEFV